MELERLSAFDEHLLEVAEHTNLLSRSTIEERWERHYADSLQLWALVPDRARTLLDIGSGAGFPGLILACLAAERRPNLRFTLCDSVGKKGAFLTSSAERVGLANTVVRNARAETLRGRFDVVTARAVMRLDRLLQLATPRLEAGGVMILPKGRAAEEEVREAKEGWRMTVERVESRTDSDATILVITEAERRS